MTDDRTDPPSNWPGPYLSLEQSAKLLATKNESHADVFDALGPAFGAASSMAISNTRVPPTAVCPRQASTMTAASWTTMTC